MNEYPEIGDLAEIYLEDSWVLAVVAEPGVVRFEVDFVLTERHTLFSPPEPDEQYCYQHGSLIFEGVSSLQWSDQGRRPARDATGEIDYGNIDSMMFDGTTYELEGLWGTMTVVASSVRVILD